MTTIYSILGSSLLAEWAADDASTIYEDTGGTDLAEDGDGVAAWRTTSNSVLSLLATQSTSGNRPLYRANYASSGYPGVEFDGTNDGLLIPHDAAFDTSELTVFAVSQADALSTYRFIWSRLSSGAWTNGQMLFATTTTNNIAFAAPNYNVSIASRLSSTGGRRLDCGRKNTNSVSIFGQDESVIGSQNVSTVTPHSQQGGIGNGGGAGGNFPWDGPIFHLLVCTGSCGITEIEQVLYLLGQRWGISYPTPPGYGSSGGTSRLINGGLIRGQVS